MSTPASHHAPVTHRQTLGDLLRRSAKRTPGKLAVACGSHHYTYAEFDALCARVSPSGSRPPRGFRRPS